MKPIEISLPHFVVAHTLAGMMCGFLLQWSVTGWPADRDINADVKAAVRKVNDELQAMERKRQTTIHSTAPNPIPPASDDLIPATILPEK